MFVVSVAPDSRELILSLCIVGAAGAAIPFLERRAQSACRPKLGSDAAYIIWNDFFLTDYELISRREVTEMEKFRHHSIP